MQKEYVLVQTDEDLNETKDTAQTTLDSEGPFMNKEIFTIWTGLAKAELNMLLPAALALLVQTTGTLMIPHYAGKVVELLVQSIGHGDLLTHNLVYFGAVLVIVGLCGTLNQFLFEVAGQRIEARLKAKLYNAIIAQELGYFDFAKTGELINRLTSDTLFIQQAVAYNLSYLCSMLLQVTGSLFLCSMSSWKLFLYVICMVPIIGGLAWVYGRFIRDVTQQIQDQQALTTAFADETLTNISTVRAFCAEEFSSNHFDKLFNTFFAVTVRRTFTTGGWNALVGVLGALALSGSLWLGGMLVNSKDMTVADLTSFIVYLLVFTVSFSALSNLYTEYMKAVGATKRIFAIMLRNPAIPIEGGLRLNDLSWRGRIQFDAVSFAYPARPREKVLDKLTLDIKPGTLVALVGPSGGGKTTIAKLLMGLYYPDEGRVLIDGMDIKELSIPFLREKITIVGQEPVLFAMSILDNITYGCTFASEEEKMAKVNHACQLANVDFLDSLKDGLNTMVGERGTRLSGGQKQRVAIARALIREPHVLIFDEATSALDTQSERKVQATIDAFVRDRVNQQKTVIVVAHRLSTVINADVVLVIADHTVVEQGTHHELLSANGVYANLIQHQLMEDIVPERKEKSEPSSLNSSFYLNRSTLKLVDPYEKNESLSNSLEIDDEFREEYESNRPKVAMPENTISANPFDNIQPTAPTQLQNDGNDNNDRNNNNSDGSDFDWGAAITII